MPTSIVFLFLAKTYISIILLGLMISGKMKRSREIYLRFVFSCAIAQMATCQNVSAEN